MMLRITLICCLFYFLTPATQAQFEQTEDELNIQSLRTALSIAGGDRASSVEIQLPDEQGQMITYQAWESNFLSRDLAKKRPDYHSYIIVATDDPLTRGRLAVSDFGIDATVLTPRGMLGIHPKEGIGSGMYEIYLGTERRAEVFEEGSFCSGADADEPDKGEGKEPPTPGREFDLSNGGTLQTYDLAIVTTGEFHNANGGTVPAAETVVMNSVNSIQVIYENEFAVRYNLQTPYIYTDPATDPFESGMSRTSMAAAAVDDHFAVGEYDLGHVFHDSNEPPDELPGGGIATLNSVCDEGSSPLGGYKKGRGWSGSGDNTTNSWIQLASHEIGHMFDAYHTFNGEGGSCDANINGTSSYEIGSGTTIMSYNGICGSGQNIPSSGVSDNYFHAHSLERMINYMNAGGDCPPDSTSGNTPPTVDADTCGGTHTIPVSTPFELRGYANDPDGDLLTYSWEQYDEDGSGTPTQGHIGSEAAGDADAPLFRSFPPTTDPVRTFPSQSLLLANDYSSSFEPLSTVARTMHFRLTVRDNHPGAGGLAINDVTVDVDSDGPFEVTAPNGGESWSAGDTETVSWNVNGTNSFCGTVNILLSIDGGQTYPYVLAEDVTNDGSESVTIPNGVANTGQARMRVECAEDACIVFFDISNDDFELTSNCEVISSTVCPDTALTFPEGDPALDLDLTEQIGVEISTRLFSADSNSPEYDFTSDDGNGDCLNHGFDRHYDILEFTVTQTGLYSFSFENFPSPFLIANLFENSFDENDPCSTWLASSGTDDDGIPFGMVGSNGSFSDSLNACNTYYLVVSRYSSNDDFSDTMIFSGPGDVIESQGLPADYSYTYVAVDAGSDLVIDHDAGADFTSLSDGEYCVYGMMYKSGGPTPPQNVDPADFIGETLNGLLASGDCLLPSSNCAPLTVTPVGGCDAGFTYDGVQSEPAAPFNTKEYCESASDPTPVITGDSGGSFSSVPGGLNLNGSTGTIDISASATGSYTVTYTVTGGGGCSESVEIVIEAEPDAGVNGDITLCSTDAATDLFDELGGSPDMGGSWSGPSPLANGDQGTYDPATEDPGTYTYTVAGDACPDDMADVTVTENEAPDAGTAQSPFTVCETNASVNLNDGLTGEDPGGSWNDDDNTGALSGNIFDATAVSPGQYDFTYTVSVAACPDDMETLTVTVEAEPDAGTAQSPFTVCETNASVNLNDGLTGQDPGGSWNDDDGTGALNGNILDASSAGPGVYDFTYVVSGTACPDDSTTLTVTVEEQPDAGTGDSVTVCETGSPVDLYDELGGMPDTGGSWSGPSSLGNGYLGTYDPLLDDPGTYTYTVTGDVCPSSTAQVYVNESLSLDAGTPVSPFIVCETNSAVNLNDGLTGEDPGGTWSDDDNTGALSGNIFDATQVAPGMYDFTYTVSAMGCPDDSETLTVTVEDAPDAGSGNSVDICEDGGPTDLFEELGGSPDMGGSWSGPSPLANGDQGTYDPATDDPGTYTYTVSGNECPDDMADIVVNEIVCPDSATLSGTISSNNGDAIDGVDVVWSGDESGQVETGGNGAYSFSVSTGSDVTISATHDVNWDEYISTFDLVLIQSHILDISPLGSPYQLIAADASNDQSISTFDLVQIQSVLLGISPTFPSNGSWRFVPASYVFPNPDDPWDPVFPEEIVLSGVPSDSTGLDFVGVKIGDVTDVNDPDGLGESPPVLDRSDPYRMYVDAPTLQKGEQATLWFAAGATEALWGYQMSIGYDREAIELKALHPAGSLEGLDGSNFRRTDRGLVLANYYKGLGRRIHRPVRIFGWEIRAKRSIRPGEWTRIIRLNDIPLRSEAYLKEREQKALVLEQRLGEEEHGFVLYPNRPNPYREETVIAFELPEASSVDIEILDVSGHLLMEEEIQGRKGYNEWFLDGDRIQEGMKYYRVSTTEFSAVRRMVQLK